MSRKREWDSGEIFVLVVMSGLVLYGAALLAYGFAAGDKPAGPKASLTDWISALSTLVAFIVATAAVGVAWRALGVERERDRHRDEREMRAQAEQVAAWAEVIHNAEVTHTWGAGETGPSTMTMTPVVPESIVATVRNATVLPVNALSLLIYVLADDSDYESEPVLVGSVHIGQVLGGDWGPSEILTPPLTALLAKASADRAITDLPMSVLIGWSFQDNAGVWWLHTPRKQLVPDTIRVDATMMFFPPGVDAAVWQGSNR